MQLRIAAGEPLPLQQQEVALNGWAVEARICAEDASRDFAPTTGIVSRYAVPRGKGIRVDDGISAGSLVTIHYDSMLSKVIAHGHDRKEAVSRLNRALNGYHIEGLDTNVDFANAVVNHPTFEAGELSTDFIDEHFEDGQSRRPPEQTKLDYMIMAGLLVYHNRQGQVRESLGPMSPLVGRTPGPPKMTRYKVKAGEDAFDIVLEGDPESGQWRIEVDGREYHVTTPEFEFYRRRLKLLINGDPHMFRLRYQENHIMAFFCGIVRLLEVYTPLEWELSGYMPKDRSTVQENELKCPMPGLVIDVGVGPGDFVRKGQELLRIEAMKMQSSIAAPRDGLVASVNVSAGDTVETDQVLLRFENESG
jgi:propionyl-CoA carboxylase alpha chain